MALKLPIDTLFAQVRGQGNEVNTMESNIASATTGEIVMRQARPETRTTCNFEDTLGRAIGKVWVAERASENAQQH